MIIISFVGDNVKKLKSYLSEDPIGIYLLLFGIGYILTGIGWYIFPSHPRETGLNWTPLITQGMVASLWMMSGTISVFTASVAKSNRRWGFMALQIVSLFVAMLFLISIPIGFLPSIPKGEVSSSIINATNYLMFWVSTFIIGKTPAEQQFIGGRYE